MTRERRVIDLDDPQQVADHYEAETSCSNCQHAGTVYIPKGVLISGAECPNCGCRTLERLNPQGRKLSDGVQRQISVRQPKEQHVLAGGSPIFGALEQLIREITPDSRKEWDRLPLLPQIRQEQSSGSLEAISRAQVTQTVTAHNGPPGGSIVSISSGPAPDLSQDWGAGRYGGRITGDVGTSIADDLEDGK